MGALDAAAAAPRCARVSPRGVRWRAEAAGRPRRRHLRTPLRTPLHAAAMALAALALLLLLGDSSSASAAPAAALNVVSHAVDPACEQRYAPRVSVHVVTAVNGSDAAETTGARRVNAGAVLGPQSDGSQIARLRPLRAQAICLAAARLLPRPRLLYATCPARLRVSHSSARSVRHRPCARAAAAVLEGCRRRRAARPPPRAALAGAGPPDQRAGRSPARSLSRPSAPLLPRACVEPQRRPQLRLPRPRRRCGGCWRLQETSQQQQSVAEGAGWGCCGTVSALNPASALSRT